MATKTKKKPTTKKIGFQKLSKAERSRVASLGGKATAKKMRKLKKG
jgi:hypothetical protein